MQFLLSKYIMPADASRHIETNWRTDNVLELFLKYDNRDPPKSTTYSQSRCTLINCYVIVLSYNCTGSDVTGGLLIRYG